MSILEDFKRSVYVKEYNSPVKNIIDYDKWILGYCNENGQNILSISHSDGIYFEVDEPFEKIEGLKELFHYDVSFSKSFPTRGFTRMYIDCNDCDDCNDNYS